MGSDMQVETCYHIMELLSDPLGPEWEASRQKIKNENRGNWSRACGLWGRPDLRPKISVEQKRAITIRNKPLDLPHTFNASPLDVQMPDRVVNTSSAEPTQGEHSPEVSTPVPVGDDANTESPRTPEADTASGAQEHVILREGSARRVSLTETERAGRTPTREHHNFAAQ